MTIGETDMLVLRALAKARGQHQELAVLLDFYYDLYEVQFQTKSRLPEPEVRDELAMRWRLEGGIPQLTFAQLRVDEAAFSRLVSEVSDVILRHNPGWELGGADRTPQELVAEARHVYETWESLTSPRPGNGGAEQAPPDRLAAMAVGLALAPHLQKAADAILPRLDLSLWRQGYCPVCGGVPNFSLLGEESGARKLMCSRCASLWQYPRIGCPFCGTTEAQPYYAGDDETHRLYVCSVCKRYLKAADLRRISRVVHPVVERLLTVGMDLAAQQEGYGP